MRPLSQDCLGPQRNPQPRPNVDDRYARVHSLRGGMNDSEAESAALAAFASRQPYETFADLCEVGVGQPGTVISDSDREAVRFRRNRHRRPAAGTIIADRIVEQVGDDLEQQGSMRGDRRRRVGRIEYDIDLRFDRLGDAAVDNRDRHFAQINLFERRRGAGFFGAGECEQLRHQMLESFDCRGYFRQGIGIAALRQCHLHLEHR